MMGVTLPQLCSEENVVLNCIEYSQRYMAKGYDYIGL